MTNAAPILSLPTDNDLQQMERERILRWVNNQHQVPEHICRMIGIPKKYREKALQELRAELQGKARAAANAATAGMSILITGSVGTGKTHLATCLLWEVIREDFRNNIRPDIYGRMDIECPVHKKYRWTSAADIADETEAAAAIGGGFTAAARRGEVVQQLAGFPTLLIDDLGFGRSDVKATGLIADLIDKRYRKDLQTIATTNLTIDELSRAIDDRVVSRLVEDGIVIEIQGEDFRRRILEENKRKVQEQGARR